MSGSTSESAAEAANAILDLDAAPIRFAHDGKPGSEIRLTSADGRLLDEWHGFQNAATLGGAVRAVLGAPHYPFLEPAAAAKDTR